MSDRPDPPLPRDPDDVASDVVDGLLPPADAEAAQRDPAVAQRVERIQQARAALRSTPPVDPTAANRAIAAAVDAFDAAPTEAHPSGPPERERRLRAVAAPDAPRPSAHPPSRSYRPWLAAAAVLLVALATVGVLARSRNESDHSTAQRATAETGGDTQRERTEGSPPADDSAAEEGATSADRGAGAAPEALGDGSSTAAGDAQTQATQDVVSLGQVRDADELVERVSTSLTRSPSAPAAPSAASPVAPGDGVAGCPGSSLDGDPSRGPVVFVGDATLDGNPVRVHVYQSGAQRQVVATDRSCIDVVDAPLGR